MNDSVIRFYQRLPPSARSLTASLRGAYLSHWRYGRETPRLADEALARENWGKSEWKNWQEERLAYVLHRAATKVPYYRAHWAERRQRGDRASWDYLENWPILPKSALREQPNAFKADDVRGYFREQTSGTTGTPLTLWWSKRTTRSVYAIIEARLRAWNDVSRNDRWAAFGGQRVVAADAKKPPFWVWNAVMHQVYLSTHHLSRDNASSFVEALESHRASHMITYASSAALLAGYCLEQGIDPPSQLRVVLTNSEALSAWQRATIQKGLCSVVRETYGMAEAVTAASECSHGSLHLWPEFGWVEVLDDNDMDVPATTSGRLVCTSLLNADFPLIRYEVGDRGNLASVDATCACGRTLPIVSRIEGRTNDVLTTPDGRKVYWINPVFYGLPLLEAQVVQEAIDHVTVRYVAGNNFTSKTAETIVDRLRSILGEVDVVLESVVRIPRTSSGKFQPVVCKVPTDELCTTGGV